MPSLQLGIHCMLVVQEEPLNSIAMRSATFNPGLSLQHQMKILVNLWKSLRKSIILKLDLHISNSVADIASLV